MMQDTKMILMTLLVRYGTKECLDLLASIIKTESRRDIFFLFCEKRSLSSKNIMNNLLISEPTVYRVLRHFKDLGIIEPDFYINDPKSLGGPRVCVWRLTL